MALHTPDLEVKFRTEQSKAVIEGKTSVPFKTFVMLVLQRKIIPLFKDWGNEPIIVNSELLTNIASAPQDSQENRTQLVLVTLGVGMLTGIFVFAVAQIFFVSLGVIVTRNDLLLVSAVILGLACIATILSKVQRKSRGQKIADSMERLTSLLSK